MDVHVVALGVLHKPQAQRPRYLHAPAREAIRKLLQGYHKGASFPPKAQEEVDVGLGGRLYALDLERVAHLCLEHLDYGVSDAVGVAWTRHLLPPIAPVR